MSSIRNRIAFLVPYSGRGGAEVALENLLRKFPYDEFDVFLISPNSQSLTELAKQLPIKVIDEGVGATPSTSWVFRERHIFNPFATVIVVVKLVYFAMRLRRYLRDNSINILYTTAMISHLIGAVATFWSGRQLIWHVHDIMAPEYMLGIGPRLFGFLAFHSTKAIIVPSQATADSIKYSRNTVVVPNGIPINHFEGFEAATLRAELGIASDTVLVGLVGRLIPWKGHRVLLEAISLLIGAGYRFQCLIVGDETLGKLGYRAELERLAEHLQIQQDVIFTGYRTDVPNIMSGLDIVVVPSIRPEPFGLVIVEAMASGKPIIASDAAGPSEIVVHNQTGLLFRSGDSQALAAAIELLLTQPNLREKYGQHGLSRVKEIYAIDQYVSRIVSILRSVQEK